MPEYALRIRRFNPDVGSEPWWDEASVDLDAHRSVLDAVIALRERDGTLAIRYSCRAAICGSCTIRVNGRSRLACHTHLQTAQDWNPGEPITVEPMANMPVIKDLVVDMDAVHWKKIRRVQPWLVASEPVPEREYLVPHETMVDITQTQACIQCAACVSSCLSLEVDPEFVGPAALAKAFRFVGDPRDADGERRVRDLADDPHGIYDCTHCFNCIDACPKGVAPMNQIIRLRRVANADFGIVDRNNGHRHELGFVENLKRNGRLDEVELILDSYGRRSPRVLPALLQSLPVIATALRRGKIGREVLGHPHRRRVGDLSPLFDAVAARRERVELNLYVSGYEDDPTPSVGDATGTAADAAAAAPGPDARRHRGRPI